MDSGPQPEALAALTAPLPPVSLFFTNFIEYADPIRWNNKVTGPSSDKIDVVDLNTFVILTCSHYKKGEYIAAAL